MKKQVWFIFKVSLPISINIAAKSTFIIFTTKVEEKKKLLPRIWSYFLLRTNDNKTKL